MAMYPPARGSQEPFNPYSSPTAPLRRAEDEFGYPPLSFGVSETLARSWAIFQSRMGFCIGTSLGWLAVYLGSFIAAGAAYAILASAANDPIIGGLIVFLSNIAVTVYATWLNIGLTVVMLKLARGRLASFGDVFAGGPYLIPTIFASLVVCLLVLAAMIATMLPVVVLVSLVGGDESARGIVTVVGFGLAFLFIAGMGLRLSQFTYAIVDRGLGPIESLRVSARATSGRWFSLLLIWAIVGIINLAGAIALGVGLLFTWPFSLLILAVTYTAFVEVPKSAPGVDPGWRKPEASLDF